MCKSEDQTQFYAGLTKSKKRARPERHAQYCGEWVDGEWLHQLFSYRHKTGKPTDTLWPDKPE